MSVNIQLDKEWKIKSDERNWILAKRRLYKDRYIYESRYFFSELEPLLQEYGRIRCRTVRATSIQDLTDSITELKNQLTILLFGIELN